jgi:hypothetical protein
MEESMRKPPPPQEWPQAPTWELDMQAAQVDDGNAELLDQAEPERDPFKDLLTAGLVGVGVGLGVYLLNQLGVKVLIDGQPAPAAPATPPRRRGAPRRRAARARAATPKQPRPTPPPAAPPPPPPPRRPSPFEDDQAAAELLGVRLDATEAEINDAYRRIVREKLAAGGFGDQGGDPVETQLINAAKQRMKDRARRRAAGEWMP